MSHSSNIGLLCFCGYLRKQQIARCQHGSLVRDLFLQGVENLRSGKCATVCIFLGVYMGRAGSPEAHGQDLGRLHAHELFPAAGAFLDRCARPDQCMVQDQSGAHIPKDAMQDGQRCLLKWPFSCSCPRLGSCIIPCFSALHTSLLCLWPDAADGPCKDSKFQRSGILKVRQYI